MNPQARAAIAVWRTRASRGGGQRAFSVYLGLMVALVVLAPVGRAVWLSASGPEGVALLAASAAPAIASLVATALWAGAFLLGRERGPALRPPFLTHALASSDIPIAVSFRGPLLRSGASVSALCAAAAALAGAAGAAAVGGQPTIRCPAVSGTRPDRVEAVDGLCGGECGLPLADTGRPGEQQRRRQRVAGDGAGKKRGDAAMAD